MRVRAGVSPQGCVPSNLFDELKFLFINNEFVQYLQFFLLHIVKE